MNAVEQRPMLNFILLSSITDRVGMRVVKHDNGQMKAFRLRVVNMNAVEQKPMLDFILRSSITDSSIRRLRHKNARASLNLHSNHCHSIILAAMEPGLEHPLLANQMVFVK